VGPYRGHGHRPGPPVGCDPSLITWSVLWASDDERIALFLGLREPGHRKARDGLGVTPFDFGPIADAAGRARAESWPAGAYADWSNFDEDRRLLTKGPGRADRDAAEDGARARTPGGHQDGRGQPVEMAVRAQLHHHGSPIGNRRLRLHNRSCNKLRELDKARDRDRRAVVHLGAAAAGPATSSCFYDPAARGGAAVHRGAPAGQGTRPGLLAARRRPPRPTAPIRGRRHRAGVSRTPTVARPSPSRSSRRRRR